MNVCTPSAEIHPKWNAVLKPQWGVNCVVCLSAMLWPSRSPTLIPLIRSTTPDAPTSSTGLNAPGTGTNLSESPQVHLVFWSFPALLPVLLIRGTCVCFLPSGSATRRRTAGEWGPCIGAAPSVALVTSRVGTCVFVSNLSSLFWHTRLVHRW